MLNSLIRIYKIINILIYYRLIELLPRKGLFRLIRWSLFLHPSFYKDRFTEDALGLRLRLALESLGPLFVKLGQTLSTRPDLIPPEMAEELNNLQDRVPPFDGKIAKSIIQESLKDNIDQLFQSFDEKPLASASVAQVHAAVLHSGKDVVVKVLRPDVEKMVGEDIKLMYILAWFLNKSKDGRRLRPKEVVDEFKASLDNELDLMNEAASASQVRANFEGSEILYAPKIFWSYCRSRVMVQERIYFMNISNEKEMQALAVDKKKLAERGVKIFFTQVFKHSFFHADMHPGNIFVDVADPSNPKYCAIDFGIMGSLTPDDQHYLAENFLAFFNRDYRRVAELHIESGWVPANTRITDFESAIRKVSEPIFGRPIKEISFGAFLFSLFQTARKFDMQIQPQLVLLQKTFFNVEGLGRRLYPDLDLWTTAKPVLESWMKEQIGPKAMVKHLKANAHEYIQALPKVPLIQYRLLKKQLINSDHREKASKKSPFGLKAFTGVMVILVALLLWIIVKPDQSLQNVVLLMTAMMGFILLIRKDK